MRRCSQWVIAAKRLDLDEIFHEGHSMYNFRICEDHFDETDFKNPNLKSRGYRSESKIVLYNVQQVTDCIVIFYRLRGDAIPSKNLPEKAGRSERRILRRIVPEETVSSSIPTSPEPTEIITGNPHTAM